jgi:N6-L-threonylcarbamoyladenine synthase
MIILAFETSCDDTAVAIIENGTTVLSSVRVSQLEHNSWGGVVPEIAARLHAEAWKPVLEQALKESGLEMTDMDYIAVTYGPGLQTSLLSGTTAASFLSLLYNIPLIPVHHVYGHLCSVFLDREADEVEFPALVLTASGGHTEFYLWENASTWQKLGGSIDDAVGEAFDKLAKMLGLGYPGGPEVSKRAVEGNSKAFNLPIPNLGKGSLDLSFSGVKSAVRRLVLARYPHWLEGDFTGDDQSEAFINDLCASFEETCGRIFKKKLVLIFDLHPEIKAFYFVGGVSANTYLMSVFNNFVQRYGKIVMTPKKIEYSTDNAAMIGSAAYWQLQNKAALPAAVQYIESKSRLKL